MSIIHDALKKVQLGQAFRDETPAAASVPNPATGGDIFSSSTAKPNQEPAVVELPADPPPPPKNNSWPALLCSIAVITGALWFFFKQLDTYFPELKKSALASYHKLVPVKLEPTPELRPLARIAITPSEGGNIMARASARTLNVQGVMANGKANLVLINDRVYQEGDEVDGVKILKINLDGITVINNGREERVPVKK